MYLGGDFGKKPSDVNAYAASVFYTVDRYASFKTKWEDIVNDPDAVIIFDRYVTSNMIHQAVKVSKQRYPGLKVGILATNGTLDANVYSDVYKAEGVEVVEPTAEERDILMDIIYNQVKAGKIPTDAAPFEKVLKQMAERGAGYFVLGCTELPVAVQALQLQNEFVDATAELAKAAIEYCGYEVKE